MKKTTFIFALILFISGSIWAEDPLSPLILTNHLGYNPSGTKRSIILGFEKDNFTKFKVIDYRSKSVVLEGRANKSGPVQKWKNWYFWSIDFSSLEKEGTYYIESKSKGKTYTSYPFDIQENILERHTISDIVSYFRSQRPAGLFEKADKNLPVMKYNDKDSLVLLKRVDATGGWADATGDYSKVLSHLSHSIYFNPQQIPIADWSLFKSYEELSRRKNQGYTQFLKKMRDEAIYGADYFVNIKIPNGSFYRSVSCWGKKRPEDRRITPTNRNTGTYSTSYREGAGMAIASLAIASRFHISGKYSNGEYLRTAEDAFDFLEKYNSSLSVNGKENIIDDYCALMAAVELYNTTKKEIYIKAADKRAISLMSRLVSNDKYSNYWRADEKNRPFFHAADAGLPVVGLLNYATIVSGEKKKAVLDVVRKSLEFELSITAEVNNPFGYARQFVQFRDGKRQSGFFFPHRTETGWWWQGENARLGSLASAAKLAAQFFNDDKIFSTKLRNYAYDQINWILGLNPYDACMLEGSGHNNPQYLFYGSWEYKGTPGGIVNGITAGMTDYEDIDFEKGYAVTGEDDDWRWLEQWIPHASWFMYAVSIE